jgi:hypothetical protein
MADHPRLDASELEVRVADGQVTLLGVVSSRMARRLAEDIADSVSGVRDVDGFAGAARYAGWPELTAPHPLDVAAVPTYPWAP